MAEEYELYLTERLSNDRSFEQGALYAGKNALIYDSVQEEGNIYTVLKNSDKKYVDSFEVIKGELIFSSQSKQELDWAQEIGIKVSPYLIIDGELMSSNTNLYLMDEATGTITIPQNVTKIGAGAFRDVTGLRSIVIPGTVKEIGEYAFSGNPTLENVVIEEGLEKIGSYAFQDCSALKTIKIANSVSYIGISCFENCGKLADITLPNSIDAITYRMLSRCSSLETLIIPEGVTQIGELAFEMCVNLKKVVMPSTISSINGTAFNSNTSLKNIEISEDNETYSFANGSLMSRNGKILVYILANTSEINIPETVEIIQNGVCETYPRQAVLNISKNVREIRTIFNNNITRINVVEDNPYFKSQDGNLYNKEMTEFYRYTQNQTSFIMPNTVKLIRNKAFQTQTNLKDLTLSENLEEMHSWIFSFAGIEQLHLPKKLNNVSTGCFSGANLTVSIDEENPYIKTEDGTTILSKDGKKLLATTKSLETYNIPSSVEIISNQTFYSREKLINVKIPEGIKTIGGQAFDACTYLEKVEIPASVEAIAGNAFSRCNNLRQIIINKEKGSISGAPWGCPNTRDTVFWKN